MNIFRKWKIPLILTCIFIYQDDWRISIAQGNGFIYISINYIGKLYVSVVLSYIICRLKYKYLIDLKVSFE